jgi:hypothetical protein
MKEINGEPVIELDFNDLSEDSGMSAISFVERPATLTTWFRFSEEEKQFNFEKDEMKRVVTGPVMLADTPIRRYDGEQRYWVEFTADTIFKMRNKYFKEQKIHNVNENHNQNEVVDGVYMVESFIIDEKTKTNLYPDIPVGTWMASFWVEDEKYWNDVIMSDKFNGFSLEGNFGIKNKKNKYSAMNIIQRLKELFSEIEDEETKMFIDVKTEDGRILRVSAMEPGSSITEITEEGELALEPGEYSIIDDSGLVSAVISVVEEGVISSINPVEKEYEPEFNKNKKKKMKKFAKRKFETTEAEDLATGEDLIVQLDEVAVGEEVIVIDEEMTVVEDFTGDLIIEDQEVSIENGVITEVGGEEEEAPADNGDEVVEEMKKQFSKIFNELNEIKNENKKLKERFNKFSAEPSVEPTKVNPSFKEMTTDEKLKFFGKRK